MIASYSRTPGTEEAKDVEDDDENFRIDPAISQRMSRYCEATQVTNSSMPSDNRVPNDELLVLMQSQQEEPGDQLLSRDTQEDINDMIDLQRFTI